MSRRSAGVSRRHLLRVLGAAAAAATSVIPCLIAPPAGADQAPPPAVPGGPARGADELYWAPTLEQALEMADATGRPLFLMGFSLVGNGSTYTKFGPDYCSGVY